MKKGQIIKSTGSWYTVSGPSGDTIQCRLPGRFRLAGSNLTNPVAVGDFVSFSLNEDGTGLIENIHPRKNHIIRKATHGKTGSHILASNIDLAFVVQAVKQPRLNTGFIDRFLVSCESFHIKPAIIINKTDLASKKNMAGLQDLKVLYEGLGYPVVFTCIHDEDSLTELTDMLKGNTSVFIGPSGAGKTSLLNAIDASYNLKVGAVSGYSGKGKHTTTFAQMVELNIGAKLIDTPGIREFGLTDTEPWELSLYFPEMLEPRKQCRFNNCTHLHEPDCGVYEAFEQGRIDAGRYNSYINILESLPAP